jgi:hypothetical protein
MSFGHLPGIFLEIFFWFQKVFLNISRRRWQRSSMSFGNLPGAFLNIFFWFQKITLGNRLPRSIPGPLGGPAACPLATCRALSWRFSFGFRK